MQQLKHAVLHDPDWECRRLGAVRIMNDKNDTILAEILVETTDEEVRSWAADFIRDDDILAGLAAESSGHPELVRAAAARKLSDEAVLEQIAKSDPSELVREAAAQAFLKTGKGRALSRVAPPPFEAFPMFRTESANEATRFIREEALPALPNLSEADAAALFGYWSEDGTAPSRHGSAEAMMAVIGVTLRAHTGREGFKAISISADLKRGCAMIVSIYGGVANLMPIWKRGSELLVGSSGGFV